MIPCKFYLVFALLCSCVLLESGTKTPEMPSVWQKNHGEIPYQDIVTNEQGKLTTFWAQEAIGVPESKEFIAELKAQGIELKGQEIGVIDAGSAFDVEKLKEIGTPKALLEMCVVSIRSKACKIPQDEHAMKVINLIADRSPVGVSSTGTISYIDYLSGITAYKKQKLPPIMNQSGTIYDKNFTENVQKDFASFVDRTILVKSSGNEFPELPGHQTTQYGQKTIVVGSVDPTGFYSHFSQSTKELVVLAPSDMFVQSRGAGGVIGSFGGTSGAAPQVTGALADIKSILPSLTRDEAALLFRKTSTPTSIAAISSQARNNGIGTLNQYRALRVAKRLKDKGFPTNRQTLLNDESIYDFKDEARKLINDATTDPTIRLKNLRKSFFLDPDNTSVRNSLADIYSSYGFDIQSRFYDDPKKVIKLRTQIAKVYSRAFLAVKQQVKKMFRDYGVSMSIGNNLEFDKYFSEMSANNQLALIKRFSGALEKSMLQTSIEVAGHLADQGTTEPLQLLIEKAKTTHPDLLTEKHISKIIQKHTGSLGKIITGIKDLDVKKIARVVM